MHEVTRFLTRYCHDCHAGETTEGGLDLQQLSADVSDAAVFARWERLYDRVQTAEMPPADADQPDQASRERFASQLAAQLEAAHAKRSQTVLRRLNRREYENTLNDLFGTHLSLAELLPEDGKSHEFDNIGESLGLSLVQMQRYLECADLLLNEAIPRTISPPERSVLRASYADTRGAEQWLGRIWLHREDGAVVFFKEYGYPTGMLREANVRREGWYTVRITGYAFQSDVPITFSVGATTFARGVAQPTFGFWSLPPGEPKTIALRAWIPERYMIDITPYGITDHNNEIRRNGIDGYAGPGLAIQHVEIEGPFVDAFPGSGFHLLFDGLDRREIPPRNPADRDRPNYVPKFVILSDNLVRDVTPVLSRVATRAFRRPVTAEQLESYVRLFKSESDRGATTEEALRTAVAAILCAPEFLYLQEPNGWLDDHALAARLSYFLTRTLPDAELLDAGTAGRLTSDPTELQRQVDRLLHDPRSARFVADFTDAWLNLREIDFTNPDGSLFPEFDPFLKWSMIAETRAYFRRLIDDNLGVVNVVRSDFAMLNSRLAEHYGISGVDGPEIRAVSLPPDSVRGGFLSQAGVLKVSANGTNTSPVVRGVFVMERVLGEVPPPPPAGVPGVEPDIRGATTLRELLERHRSLDSCRHCHQMIDPPGFAMEGFNPIGGWRDRFRTSGDGDRVSLEVRGQKVRYRLGLPVDASGSLPDGRTFADFREFRDLLAEDRERLARSLTSKLLTFATGREMGFSDRAEIRQIVHRASESDFGIRDLIRLVVSSEIFRRK